MEDVIVRETGLAEVSNVKRELHDENSCAYFCFDKLSVIS